MADPDRAEQGVCRSLRAILDRVSVGDALWASDYDTPDGSYLLSALQFFLPRLLRPEHPFWGHESLDGFRTVVARKTGDRSAELFGCALLITDQRWTPFELELRLSSAEDRAEWVKCAIGSPGDGAGGLDRRYRWQDEERAVRQFEEQRGRIEWVFQVSLDRAAPA